MKLLLLTNILYLNYTNNHSESITDVNINKMTEGVWFESTVV